MATDTNGVAQNGESQRRFESLVSNVLLARQEFFRKFLDPRRDIADECGYPRTTELASADYYRDLYDRNPIANRVVSLMPRECWQTQPLVYETEEGEPTPFEEAWDALGRSLRGGWYQDEAGSPVWYYLRLIDLLSGVGHFGVLLFGLDDGKELWQPAAGVDGMTANRRYPSRPAPWVHLEKDRAAEEQGWITANEAAYTPAKPNKATKAKQQLLMLRAFDEVNAQVVQYETDPRNPRHGCPVMYLLTLGDTRETGAGGFGVPTGTVRVHWSRVLHVADNLHSSAVFAVPRIRPVLHRLLDLDKLYGGSAEMYWRGAFPGLSFETHPTLGGDVAVDKTGLRNEFENYSNGLQRALFTMGFGVKSLAPQVVDPTPQIQTQIQAVCIQLGVPQRVFMGSERGELASAQDDAAWNDRLRERQTNYLTPRLVVPFIDRLIQYGVLPEPSGYSVEWPDLDSLGKNDKAQIATAVTGALAQYVSGGVEAMLPPKVFLTRVLEWDEEEADAALEEAASAAEGTLTIPPPGEAGHPATVPEPPQIVTPDGKPAGEGKPFGKKQDEPTANESSPNKAELVAELNSILGAA